MAEVAVAAANLVVVRGAMARLGAAMEGVREVVVSEGVLREVEGAQKAVERPGAPLPIGPLRRRRGWPLAWFQSVC